MNNPKTDIYFLIFASIILFAAFIFFIIIFFNYYRKKQRKNFQEKEELKTAFEQELLRSQLEIQEQTFNNISQEIHDNVGQILSLAKVQINIMNESENLNRDMLDEVKQNISKALTDLRDIAKSLSSERIRNMSVPSAVVIETERINKSGTIHATVSCEGEERKMDDQKKQILFRIIQECLQNIIKHAQASAVNLSFNYLPENLDVSIKDNGKGFDVHKAMDYSSGLGLQNIKTRASLIGGTLAIESTINEGTIVTINIPYE